MRSSRSHDPNHEFDELNDLSWLVYFFIFIFLNWFFFSLFLYFLYFKICAYIFFRFSNLMVKIKLIKINCLCLNIITEFKIMKYLKRHIWKINLFRPIFSVPFFIKEQESVKSCETKIKAFVLIFTIKDILVFWISIFFLFQNNNQTLSKSLWTLFWMHNHLSFHVEEVELRPSF